MRWLSFVRDGNTTFGFFTQPALAQQVGIRDAAESELESRPVEVEAGADVSAEGELGGDRRWTR